MTDCTPEIRLSLNENMQAKADIIIPEDYTYNNPTRNHVIQTVAIISFFCGEKLFPILIEEINQLEDKVLAQDILKVLQGLQTLSNNLSKVEVDDSETIDLEQPIVSPWEVLNSDSSDDEE